MFKGISGRKNQPKIQREKLKPEQEQHTKMETSASKLLKSNPARHVDVLKPDPGFLKIRADAAKAIAKHKEKPRPKHTSSDLTPRPKKHNDKSILSKTTEFVSDIAEDIDKALPTDEEIREGAKEGWKSLKENVKKTAKEVGEGASDLLESATSAVTRKEFHERRGERVVGWVFSKVGSIFGENAKKTAKNWGETVGGFFGKGVDKAKDFIKKEFFPDES